MTGILIVNADDFGLTRAVNRGILAAQENGIVTSTTLLANSQAFDDAVSIGLGAKELGIGVHLNLTQGKAVTRAVEIRTLVDWSGRFLLTPGWLLRGILRHEVRLSDIEREFRAQIEKVIRAGIWPTHLDGHGHIHVLPGISDIVIRLAVQYGIPSVRCPAQDAFDVRPLLREFQDTRTLVLKQYLVGRAVSCFASRFRRKLKLSGLKCPDHFYGLCETGFMNAGNIPHILDQVPEGISELMCHPGYMDSELMQTGTQLLAQREVELRALTAPEVKRFVQNRQLQLKSYRDFRGPGRVAQAAA